MTFPRAVFGNHALGEKEVLEIDWFSKSAESSNATQLKELIGSQSDLDNFNEIFREFYVHCLR